MKLVKEYNWNPHAIKQEYEIFTNVITKCISNSVIRELASIDMIH